MPVQSKPHTYQQLALSFAPGRANSAIANKIVRTSFLWNDPFLQHKTMEHYSVHSFNNQQDLVSIKDMTYLQLALYCQYMLDNGYFIIPATAAAIARSWAATTKPNSIPQPTAYTQIPAVQLAMTQGHRSKYPAGSSTSVTSNGGSSTSSRGHSSFGSSPARRYSPGSSSESSGPESSRPRKSSVSSEESTDSGSDGDATDSTASSNGKGAYGLATAAAKDIVGKLQRPSVKAVNVLARELVARSALSAEHAVAIALLAKGLSDTLAKKCPAAVVKAFNDTVRIDALMRVREHWKENGAWAVVEAGCGVYDKLKSQGTISVQFVTCLFMHGMATSEDMHLVVAILLDGPPGYDRVRALYAIIENGDDTLCQPKNAAWMQDFRQRIIARRSDNKYVWGAGGKANLYCKVMENKIRQWFLVQATKCATAQEQALPSPAPVPELSGMELIPRGRPSKRGQRGGRRGLKGRLDALATL
ncbi:hypothetical protein BV25DRAFT_794277 [Artomyces pyxidatus]|uniref:Uncharacterized protein n=1 Tax=Artomyces pyxidatus TaxID=48021 RepID=A0ACB8SYB9_9AGAM|nr:hypothetical protein BV25DRAFT_794277 [Artomyces pyxidatus]